MIRLAVSATAPELEVLERAATVIRAGGVVALPTDTLYGLAVDPLNLKAVARVFAVKGRDAARALPLVAGTAAQVTAQLGELPPLAGVLAGSFWPGPLTLLLVAPPTLPPEVTAGTGRIGVRVPAHAVTRALCLACNRLLTATSANLSGEPGTKDPDHVAASLGGSIDILLDGGKTPGGPASTIADTTEALPRLVRVGAIPWDTIQACLRQ